MSPVKAVNEITEMAQELVDKAIEDLKKGKLKVFSGNYIGVNPRNRGDVINLNEEEYIENQYSSVASFTYRIENHILIDEE